MNLAQVIQNPPAFGAQFTLAQAKRAFADVAVLRRRIIRAALRNQLRVGLYLRKVARRSMKDVTKLRSRDMLAVLRRNRVQLPHQRLRRAELAAILAKSGVPVHSPPGHPPFAIQGNVKRHLYAVPDVRTQSVVIGPARLSHLSAVYGRPVPSILETGGLTRGFDEKQMEWRPKRLKPRPYMEPALRKTVAAKAFRSLWRNSLAHS